MMQHPGGIVPADMPKDLDRVYAALEGLDDTAPDALLDRILTARAAGVRTILPVEQHQPARLRPRLVRVAIAALLGLVALGTWSRLSRPHPELQKVAAAAGFGFGGFDALDFATPAEAQGALAPKFPPMTFDPSRLHPVRLRYTNRTYENEKLVDTDSSRTYSLLRSGDGGWTAVSERTMSDPYATVRMTDSVRLDRADLKALNEVYAVRSTGGDSVDVRVTITDRSATIHAVSRDVYPRPAAGTTRATASDSAAKPGAAGTRSDTPARRAAGSIPSAAAMDTTFRIVDTTFALPQSRYPRLTSAMNPSELLFKLMAVPFEAGWKRSVVFTRPGGTTIRPGVKELSIPVDLELAGDVPCQATGSASDCWKIIRHSATAETTFLIRKRDGVVVREEIDDRANGRSVRLEMTLIGEQ